MTVAPSAPNALAMPAPIPLDAPVTTAIFPFNFMSITSLGIDRRKRRCLVDDLEVGCRAATYVPVLRQFLPILLSRLRHGYTGAICRVWEMRSKNCARLRCAPKT